MGGGHRGCQIGLQGSSLVPIPHPSSSAREKGLVINDTILGPLRHFGYAYCKSAGQLASCLGFTYDHMLDMAENKYRTKGTNFVWPITGKKTLARYSASLLTGHSRFNRAEMSTSARSHALQDHRLYYIPQVGNI